MFSLAAHSEVNAGLRWHDIPTDFLVKDVFSEENLYPWHPSSSDHTTDSSDDQATDIVSFMMRRERSRSRDDEPASSSTRRPGANDPGDTPTQNDPDRSPEAEDEPLDGLLIYTNMPMEPIQVQAGPEGPTIQEAETALGFPRGSISGIHVVRSLQQNEFKYVALVECVGDYIEHASERLVLLDFICVTPEAVQGVDVPQLYHSAMISRSLISLDVLMGIIRPHRDCATTPGHVPHLPQWSSMGCTRWPPTSNFGW